MGEPMRRWSSQACAGIAGWLGITLGGVLLCTCQLALATPLPIQPVLARVCRAIDSSHEVVFQLTAPAAGVLRVEVAERGISTVSVLNDAPERASASPIDRLGTVVLTMSVRRDEHAEMKVRAEDSRDVMGEACVSADLIAPTETARIRAENDFAAAGRATRGSDWNTAFGRYLSAAQGFDRLGLRKSAAMARHAMAQLAYLWLDRKRDAYALASEALADYGSHTDPVLRGALAEMEAEALFDMPGNDPAVVAPQIRMWLAIARRYASADRAGARELPRLDILSGFLQYLLNKHEQSRGSFSLAAASCRNLGDWDCYAIANQNLAQLAEQGKDYSSALLAYTEALRMVPAGLDPKLVAQIWNNLGRLQGVVGLFSASERSHTAAMQLYTRLGDCQGVRRSLGRAGAVLAHVGNLADAASDLIRAASLDCPSLLASAAAPAGQTPIVAAAEPDGEHRNSRETNPTSVEHPCAQTLDPAPLTRETRGIIFSSVLSLGNAAMLTGDSAEVWQCLDAAQRYSPDSRNQVRLANARGTAFLDRKDPANARAAFTRALQIADEAGLPPTYDFRGAAQVGLVKAMLLGGKAAESLEGSYQALVASAARGDLESTITSLRLIAAGYRGSGRSSEAIRVLQAAADLIEVAPIDELNGEQRATFLASQHTVFSELTDIFASQSGNDSSASLAFEASERGRARSLRYALNQETRDASSPIDAPPAAKYQRLLGEVVAVTAHTSTGESQWRLIDEIDRLARQDVSSQTLFDRVQVGRALKQLDATLVEYASASTEMLAFVINGEDARVIHLGDSQAIAHAAAELRDRLRDSEAPASEVRAAAESLARLVWWPVTPYVGTGRIVVVPDDSLHTVPLAVLPWAQDPAQGMLVQHSEIAVIPSALFLMRVHPAASAHSDSPHVALIGDPVFRVADWRRECTESNTARESAGPLSRTLSSWTESLPRLPGTRLEIDAIARLAHESRPASRIETLVGCAAVPTALRKVADTNLDLLHIATHARIDAQRPRLSALALTPESPSDAAASTFGLLDILGLKLNSKLVVLSACDTSRGRLLPGEGVLGPAQAFLQAGAAAVLATYWKVDDQMTSTFMQRFYKYLLVDRLSASAALRKTQLESAASGKTYEWAAFSLYGWPDSSI
jgi:CHAT domain-containing protein/tetratricopeptide (TPR) repeat protein